MQTPLLGAPFAARSPRSCWPVNGSVARALWPRAPTPPRQGVACLRRARSTACARHGDTDDHGKARHRKRNILQLAECAVDFLGMFQRGDLVVSENQLTK